jgi:hypothetical protein
MSQLIDFSTVCATPIRIFYSGPEKDLLFITPIPLQYNGIYAGYFLDVVEINKGSPDHFDLSSGFGTRGMIDYITQSDTIEIPYHVVNSIPSACRGVYSHHDRWHHSYRISG